MKLPLISENHKKLQLESLNVNFEDLTISSDVLVLYIGGFCDNIYYLNKLNEKDKQLFYNLINELNDQSEGLYLKLFKTSTPNFYQYIIIHNGTDSNYYKKQKLNDDENFIWNEFYYALTRAALLMAENIHATSVTFTHLSSPIEEESVKAQALAIGNWWDECSETSFIKKIVFEGCGISENYLKTFLKVDPNLKLNKMYNESIYDCKTFACTVR